MRGSRYSVKVIWGHLWCTFPTNVHNLKTAHRHVKVLWGHSVYFSKKRGVTRKRLIIERTGENWASGVYVVCIWILLILNISRSFWVIPCTFYKIGS